MRRFLVRIRKFKDVVVALLAGAGLLGAILFLERFESFTQPQRGSLILVCFFLAATLITGVIDLKKGLERRIEISMIFFLASLVFLVLSFVIEDLIKANSLEIARTLAAIIASAIALFGLTIAYLNYKRKSGATIEYVIGYDKGQNPILYFTNLKDRVIVIYEFMLVSGNLEIEMPLDEFIVLSSYDIKSYKICESGSYYCTKNNKDGSGNGFHLTGQIGDYPFYSLSDSKIRARTSLGEVFIEQAPEVLLMPSKDLYLMHHPFQNEGIESYLLGSNESTPKWEKIKEDDPRIIKKIRKIMFLSQ